MSMNVDQAWDKLHARLKDEGLLVSENEKAKIVPFVVRMRRVAAVAVLCICGGAMVLYLSPKKENGAFVSIYNSDISNTLVSTLDDGSIVYLTGGAILTCPEQFTGDKRQVSLKGEALFDVHGNKDRPFLIETEPAVVEVTGTAFNIKSAEKNSFELSVQHGSVTVTLKSTGIPVRVESGETVRLHTDQLQKTWSDNQHQFARYTEKMQFKDDRLDHIVRVINKISDKPVVFADDSFKNREITIAFDNNTITEMVGLLCAALELTFTDEGKEFIIGH
jgi:ferric-dicitrate binding protein FerR (iron transport regulator)